VSAFNMTPRRKKHYSQDEKEKALKDALEEAKERMEADRDVLAEKTVDELDELEVCLTTRNTRNWLKFIYCLL
jgi:hypothetical protein